MWWFLGGIVSLCLGLFYRKSKGAFGKKQVSDGKIIGIMPENNTFRVSYSYPKGNQNFEVIMSGEETDLSALKIGMSVLVTFNSAAPEKPLCVSFNSRGKNISLKGSENAAFIIAAVCFIMGFIGIF